MTTPRYSEEIGGPRQSVRVALLIACRVADKYRRRLPTVQELMDDFGMHRATAYRWRATLAEARGISTTSSTPGEKHNG